MIAGDKKPMDCGKAPIQVSEQLRALGSRQGKGQAWSTAESGRNRDWGDGQRSACCGIWAGCLEQDCECLQSPHKPGSNVMSQSSDGLIGIKTLALRWLIGKYITGNRRSQVKRKGLAR